MMAQSALASRGVSTQRRARRITRAAGTPPCAAPERDPQEADNRHRALSRRRAKPLAASRERRRRVCVRRNIPWAAGFQDPRRFHRAHARPIGLPGEPRMYQATTIYIKGRVGPPTCINGDGHTRDTTRTTTSTPCSPYGARATPPQSWGAGGRDT